ncbi:hypothetical protein [Streptomyces cinereospinus]|uniref:ATP-grasp domain-containing protein n=1 Tax=Streptomyces cinereospinus TaxID=285561 RepID=A0ABV5N642_9ACTN
MPPGRPRILYVTDLAYQARGRRYGDEDVFLTSRLRESFALALCHPGEAAGLMDAFDAVVVRNSGPVLGHQEACAAFRRAAQERGTRVYNPLTGKADMAGKQYLVDLTAAGLPVIPSADRPEGLHRLPAADAYVVKPKLGADSAGLRVVPADRVHEAVAAQAGQVLAQPRVDFAYEVSFYFVDDAFQYALYAPHPDRRWRLEPYDATPRDLAFARRFIDWNGIGHGIQRVDACRAPDGALLLVELEDLNPYLSLDALDQERRDAFVAAMTASLHRFLAA